MFSVPKTTLKARPTLEGLRADVLAGLTVGVIALPLSMALAIASGAPPQHGLYTAVVAGVVIALAGGSPVNISGPTAAFVVILLPITQTYGLGGLLISGMMAGVILVAMGLARLGGLIQVVPYPVTIGFTAGIGVVIAVLQIPDLLGLSLGPLSGQFTDKLADIAGSLATVHGPDLLIGALTFGVLVSWCRLRSKVPAHLVALLLGSVAAALGGWLDSGFQVATIGSRFTYEDGGVLHGGIPPIPPTFAWPWELPGPDGAPVGLSLELGRALLGPAFAIAMLGALESLLCATVADGMAGTRHRPNRELIGQGLGNIAAPLFGGIPATAAIARTAANVRAGGRSPLASVVHSLFILLSILSLAPLLGYIPMASMAALLVMVAWNMSEARHFARILRVAPRGDVATLLTCFALTVLLNMEIAVAVGMGLASALFIRRTIELTGARVVERHYHPHALDLPESVLIYDINGPLFFGAAQKALSTLTNIRQEIRVIILDCTDVTMMDMTAMVAMESIAEELRGRGILLIINNLEPRMLLKLRRVGVRKRKDSLLFSRDIGRAVELALARAA